MTDQLKAWRERQRLAALEAIEGANRILPTLDPDSDRAFRLRLAARGAEETLNRLARESGR
jgi:hypothetical protein